MSPLAIRIGAGVLALFVLLTLRGKRWAYFAFVILGLAYFPAQADFKIHALKCEQLITQKLALLSLQNYAHIALFAGFYWMSWVQFKRTDARVLWALLATLVMGALVEVAEGVTGRGNCRARDLVPDAAGAVGAMLVLAIWSRLTRKPAYVRLVKKTVASRKAPAPLAPPPQPLKGLPTVPTAQVVPSVPKLSPMPAEPTEEVAPVRGGGDGDTRAEMLRRLRSVWQRVLALLDALWGVIRRRRRALAIGMGVLVFVGAAGVAVLLLIPEPASTPVAEKPEELPPPPPPRPLQVEAEGYYEPDYQFTVADRRFTRLTLKPAAFLTFARFGGKQEAGCPDARIGRDAVYLRCELERVGFVTIDGRFTSRFATSRLDAGVLSAFVTVTNPRGEVVYRARSSFRWHEPE